MRDVQSRSMSALMLAALAGTASGQLVVPFPDVFALSTSDSRKSFVILGDQADDLSGGSVASAGDVNGDGIDDIIIGARGATANGSNNAGKSYVVFGRAGFAFGTVISLSTLDGTNGFVLNGFGQSAFSGWSVASAGDVNDDGFDDLIVGAVLARPDGNVITGQTYVVFGGVGVGSTGEVDLSALNGTNGFVMSGIDAGDRSGNSVAPAGDVNGDGVDDVIIGAPDANNNAGESYVIFGGVGVGSTGEIDLSALNGTNGFVASGISPDDRSGITVSAAGDVNGDGIDDVIIGAEDADPNGIDGAGASYVIFGGAGVGAAGAVGLGSLDGTTGFVLNGFAPGEGAGEIVSRAGDVNADGFDDLLLSAPTARFTSIFTVGEAYVVFGGPGLGASGVVELLSLNGTNGFVVLGESLGDSLGTSASAAGDVNGDGIDDIIIGAAGSSPGGVSGAGQTYAIFGDRRLGELGFVDVAALDGSNGFVMSGIDEYDFSGNAVASAGDVNGDGIDDVIIGAQSADPGYGARPGAGESYVVYGRSQPQAWARASGGAFEHGANWLLGRSPTRGRVSIEPEFGGTVTISEPGDLLLAELTLDSARGVTTLDIGRSVLVSVDEPLDIPESASVIGEGILGADAGIANHGVISGPDLTVVSSVGLGNSGVVELDGRLASGVRRVGVIGPLTNNPGGEIVLRQGAVELAATPIANGGEISVAFADATIEGLFANESRTASVSGVAFNGVNAGDRAGDFVSSAGDVNGDGVDDFIIGASGADPNGNSSSGETYVIFGGVAGIGSAANFELSSLDGSNGFVITGIDTGDNSGNRVSSAGDINDDGIDDLIIGASNADPNGNALAGECYVVFGGVDVGAGGVFELSSLNGFNGFVLEGIDSGDFSGTSVSSAGDVNGDGNADLIVGARGAGPNGNNAAGESYVVFGGVDVGSGGVFTLSSLNGANGIVINGADEDDFFGTSVSSAGDVNGDGFDDIIISAYAADPEGFGSAGESYVVFGSDELGSGAVLDVTALDGSNGFVVNGAAVGDYSGSSVSSAGDINGDGIDDLVIGAIGADPDGNAFAGETFVVFGGVGLGSNGVVKLSTLNGANGFVLIGANVSDYSGISVSSAGDINGDGIDDLIIGASGADPNGVIRAGTSYVIFGAVGVGGAGSIKLSTLGGADGFVINGEGSSDQSGASVSSAGDVNADGIDDLLIGARFADTAGGNSAGKGYLVFGRRAGVEAPFPATLELSELDAAYTAVRPGRLTAASGSDLLFTSTVNNAGSIVLAADSEISILGSLLGNGVTGPSGPGSAGPVFAFGGIFPGSPPALVGRGIGEANTGIMRFDGDLELSASSQAQFQIAGHFPGDGGHDQIVVAGTFGVGGTASIELVGGYVPSGGDTFQLIEFGAISGGFSSLTIDPQLLALNVDTSNLLLDGTISIPADCPADVNDDGIASPADFTAWLSCFGNPGLPGCDRADVNGDGSLTPADFTAWLAAFAIGCDGE